MYRKPTRNELYNLGIQIERYLEWLNITERMKTLYGERLYSFTIETEEVYNDETYVPRVISIQAEDSEGNFIEPPLEGVFKLYGYTVPEDRKSELLKAARSADKDGYFLRDWLRIKMHPLESYYIEMWDDILYDLDAPEYQYSFSVEENHDMPDIYIKEAA